MNSHVTKTSATARDRRNVDRCKKNDDGKKEAGSITEDDIEMNRGSQGDDADTKSNNDNSIAGGDIEQGTLSDQSDMKRTNVTSQVEFQDTGSSDMQYSDAGLSEVSKNQPVAEIKSARVNKNVQPVLKSNQLSEIKTDAPKTSMWDKLQVASGGLEDGYDSSWKEKYNRNKRLSSKALEKVDKLHQKSVDNEDSHVVGVSFSVALAIIKLSSCGDLDGRDFGSWLIVS